MVSIPYASYGLVSKRSRDDAILSPAEFPPSHFLLRASQSRSL